MNQINLIAVMPNEISNAIVMIIIMLVWSTPVALFVLCIAWNISKIRNKFRDVLGYLVPSVLFGWGAISTLSCLNNEDCSGASYGLIVSLIWALIIFNIYTRFTNKWKVSYLKSSAILLLVFVIIVVSFMDMSIRG